MKHSNFMPEDGQFVAAWINDGVAFSQAFLHDDGHLLAYHLTSDDWVSDHGYDSEFLNNLDDVILFQLEGE